MIDLGAWLPDLPSVRAPHLRVASGCLPMAEGYEPFPALAVSSDALGSACIGAVTARDMDQAIHVYAGTSAKLYELEGFNWTDRSKSGGYGPAGDNARWRFTTYGDRLIATNGLDAIQYIDMSTAATAFANLAGSPPSAELVASFGEFVVLGSLGTSGMSIKWSGFGDSEEWTPGTNQSDEQEFADGGRLTGLAGLDVLYIFQEKCIRRMTYVGGVTIMQIDKLVDGIGCVEPQSLIQFGTNFFFLSEDGYYMFDGAQAVPIGAGRFDRWFLNNSQRAYWPKMSAAVNPQRKLVCWAFASTSSGGPNDKVLFYNWIAQKASYVDCSVEIIIGAASLGVSPDDLTTTDVDSMTVSFDDPIFLGGTSYFAGINTDHMMGSFSGPNVAATFETGDYPLGGLGRASVEWFRPITDATMATIAGAGAMKPGDSPTYQAAVTQQASGRCPQRGVNGNFVRAKMQIPDSAAWSYAEAIDLKVKAAGAR
jgi:hypothetical protein